MSAGASAAWSAAELAAFFERAPDVAAADPRWSSAHAALLAGLESGGLRAAERGGDGRWRAVAWVKQAILAGFRASPVETVEAPLFPYFDKRAFPPRAFAAADRVRLVPGGSAVRRGAHLAPGVVVMPPAFVNVGAFVGAGTLIDSHALVGSCAQVGERVHLSAGAQLGGVLEPAGALPVVVEDEAFVGALAGVFEGVCVRNRAVIAAGVVLTGSTTIYDLVERRTWSREVPAGAVVVPGARAAAGATLAAESAAFAARHGLALTAPVIVKYRDARTDAATALEQALRS
jgi:2,3,4,5-tetrahydropyridine-2-carboxylate N-succinyltransferase